MWGKGLSREVIELHPRGWLHGMPNVFLEHNRKIKLRLIVRNRICRVVVIVVTLSVTLMGGVILLFSSSTGMRER